MLQTLFDPILPIFALMAIGFSFGKAGIFGHEAARALNTFVFYIAQPALIFMLLAKAPMSGYDFPALGTYFAVEMIIYALGAWISFSVFKRELREALLIGMTCAFVNHLYYVLPIAKLIYGETAVSPITAAIIIDLAILYCGTIFLMDLLSLGKASPGATMKQIIRNPALLALTTGILANIFSEIIPSGLLTYADFAGQAAAPVLLFALGVVISGTALKPIGGLIAVVLILKVVIHPGLAWLGLDLAGTSADWKDPLILLAAGPCGAMPFVIALQYNVRTDIMTKVILISTVLTLASLAFLTG